MTKTDRPLNTDERKEVDLFVAEGFKRLGLEPATGSDEVQQAILDRLCAEVGLSGHSSEERLSLYLELGCLWGQTLCTVLGWEWALVSLDENEYYGIVTQNRSHAIFPLHYIKELLEDPDKDQTSLLVYNMLKAGDLPKAEAGQYAILG